MRTHLVAAVALAGMLGVAGCGDEITRVTVDDIGAGFADTPGGDGGADAQPVEDAGPDTTIPPEAVKRLEFVMDVGDDDVSCQGEDVDVCSVFLSFTGSRTLEVRYTADGEPIAGQVVFFAIEDDPNGIGKLSALSAYTNAEGIAAVDVQVVKQLLGGFTVKAAVSDSSVAPIGFDVTIAPKGQVPLTVIGKYAGQWPATQYTVRLYRQNDQGKPDCSDISSLYSDATANQQSPLTSLSQTVKFTEFPGLETDTPQTYTVLAFSVNENNAVLAWGCDSVDIEYGYSSSVTIDLLDRPPLYAGSYEVTSHFDFVSALPESIQPWVNTILDIFQSPTGGILKLMCDLGSSQNIGTLTDLCGYIFSDPTNPDIDNGLTTVGQMAVTIIDNLIQNYSKDSVWGDILNGGKSLADMIQDFEILATFTFKSEPDETGHWKATQTEENWHTVVVKWLVDANCQPTDDSCGKMNFSTAAIQEDAVLGSFEANVSEFWNLTIYKHPLNLKYGALLNYIIEHQLLKIIIPTEPGEPVIDTYEEFLQALLAGKECLQPSTGDPTCCQLFATNLSDSDTIQSVAESGCELLVTTGADFLRQQLVGLDTSTGDAFQLGTEPTCTFYDIDSDMVVDTFGSKALPCTWKVDLKLGSVETQIDATFWGVKSN